MNYKITQFGKELDKSKYTFDKKTKTFSTKENDLILDFNGIDGVTFKTGSDCTFKTGSDCTFKTGSSCTFDTSYGCTFNTDSDCTFKTGSSCIFNTSSYCTFKTGYNCTFKTGKQCVIIRRDIYEIIELKENQTIKLNGYTVKGYKIIEEIEIKTENGETISISKEKAKELGFNI